MVNVNDILQNQQFLDWYFRTSPETISDWEAILNNHPDWRPAVEEAIEWLQNMQLKETSIAQAQVEASYVRLQQSLGELSESKVVSMRSRAMRWWMASAAAIILVVAGIWMFNGPKPNSIQTQYGEVSAKVLPDGSEVTLNAHTSISYGKGWQEGQEREVWLKGEAYFHVKKTPQKSRFIVHTDRFDIIVTGTQFNVINRDGKTSVLLNEGSVTIKGKDGKEIKMVPGDYVEMKDNAPEKTLPQHVGSITAWKEKKMSFDSTSIQDVAKMIEDTYGVKVQVEPSASTKTPEGVSGEMSNENLDLLIQALQALPANLTIERTADTIVIK
jgi:ferric-dicitrate binding protein FerR (iron transport regulator)